MPKIKKSDITTDTKYTTKKTKKVLIDELNELRKAVQQEQKEPDLELEVSAIEEDQVVSSPALNKKIKELQQTLIALDKHRTIILNSLRSLLNITNSIFLESTSPKRNRAAILTDKYTVPLKNLISTIQQKIKVVPVIKASILK